MAKRERKVLTDIPRCPKCSSKNTVGMVQCCSIDNSSNIKKGYFCSQCLIEFDEEIIRCYSSDGSWVTNIAISN
ncbi:MAG: hypothetical protein M0Q88_03070 [Bacilli bacterium]|nr:hypothetical protein [Bacilli bacterium]